MPAKTLTIKETTYNRLKMAKRPDESFSDLFDRTIANKPDIIKFAGFLTDKEGNELASRIREYRKMAEQSYRERAEKVRGSIQ